TEEEEAAEAAEAAASAGEVEMIKEKKEEGEEGAAPAKAGEKGAEKGAAKGAEKAPAAGADKKGAPAADKKAAPSEKQKEAGGQPTFMNASGEAIRAVAAFYDVPPAKILVIVDDADLPVGHLRLRPGGSSGGHHGLESIEAQLGTREYPRLRVGIGRREGAREITGHVLGRFDSTEAALVDKVLMAAADQAQTWLTAGIQKAMSRFNGVI